MEILNIDPKVLIVQAGGFVLMVLVFKLFLFKPVQAILDSRRGEVDSFYSEAETQRKAADELRSDYEKRLAGIEEEMRAKIIQAVKEGQAMREEIIADSRAQSDRILTRAQEEIVRERDKAVAELKSTVANLAVDAASKLIEENLDTKKHREMVGKFIKDLDEVSR